MAEVKRVREVSRFWSLYLAITLARAREGDIISATDFRRRAMIWVKSGSLPQKGE